MRSILRAASVALVLLTAVSTGASAQGPQKFAYITSSVLLDQAPGRADIEAQIQKEGQAGQDVIKRMSDSLNAMVAAFEKKAPTMTQAAKDAQTKDIQAKEASYQQRANEIQQKQQARQNELVQPILDRIKAAIEDVRVEGGYSFIFNADQGSPIVAVDRNLNITDRVLAKLRAGGPPTAPAATDKKPAAPAPAPTGVTRPTSPQL